MRCAENVRGWVDRGGLVLRHVRGVRGRDVQGRDRQRVVRDVRGRDGLSRWRKRMCGVPSRQVCE